MKYLDFYNKLNSMEDKEYIENFIVYNVSQVIAGIKPASTIALKKDGDNLYGKWIKFGRSFVKSIGLEFIELRDNDKAIIVMLYNKELLEQYIFEEENKLFLNKLGYDKKEDIHIYLKKLKERYDLYHCPHELGLFLGIPIKDVKDFMKCTKKKCLLCGYWKVYNDCNQAKKIFCQYDKVKAHTLNNILNGNNSHDLAFSIKNFFCSP
ncbi:DUF3793 family protein [Clostridium weizhouense]|uniref:DUF3793 family protein n=1 Tax=Clostridium weizhouense TaxID=2859781 RepID=A0ABS7AST4_9CLOT|nr:DUF3793 family protein [Clostridium weizhouense]MBW6411729.1 DUF3793 family protein [Clostridium weizhouense]